MEFRFELVGGPLDGRKFDVGPLHSSLASEGRPSVVYFARADMNVVCTDDTLKHWMAEQIAGCFWAYHLAHRFTSDGRQAYEWRG